MDKDNFNAKNEENNDSNITDEKEIKENQEIEEESSEEAKENLEDNKDEIIKYNSNSNDNEKESEIEDSHTEYGHTKNKKRKIIIGTIIGVIILLSIIINVNISKYDSVVYPGISIYGEDVAGLNKNELNKRIDKFKNKINEKIVTIDANGKSYDLQIKDIVLDYNEDKLADKIFTHNKDKNIFKKFTSILIKQKCDYKLDIDLNKSILKEKAMKISKDTSEKCEEPKVIINGNDIKYEYGKKGINLDTKVFLATIEKCMKDNNIYREDIKISCKYIDDNPKINVKNLKKVNYKISTYSTIYGPGGGRGSNVETAAKKIDDYLLMPGDEFSYEEAVGPVTQSNGYTYAPVISNGELVQGIGGGVCQVSSTLYNTQLKAGILPTERRNHSKPVSYVPRGLDATLASGSIDYKFKNNHEYPIVINTHTGGGKLTIEIW